MNDKERVDLLRKLVATGKEAEKAQKFVDSLLADSQKTLVETITKQTVESKDVMKAAYDFRAAYFLHNSICEAIKKGADKEKKLQELLK